MGDFFPSFSCFLLFSWIGCILLLVQKIKLVNSYTKVVIEWAHNFWAPDTREKGLVPYTAPSWFCQQFTYRESPASQTSLLMLWPPIQGQVWNGEPWSRVPAPDSLANAVLLLVIGVDDAQALHGWSDVGEPGRPADVLHLLELLDSSMENAVGRSRRPQSRVSKALS